MNDQPTVACPGCQGLTFVVELCLCRSYGDTLLVTDRPLGAIKEPYRDCALCGGTGAGTRECYLCAGQGRRRPELSLTAVNLATGQTASQIIRPGTVPASRGRRGRQYLDCRPAMAALLGRVGLEAADFSTARTINTEVMIALPVGYDPAAPVEERYALEAAAIADAAGLLPWQIYPAWPGRRAADPDTVLAQLCEAAHRLRLDLVIERRVTDRKRDGTIGLGRFDVRFEVPGSAPPEDISGCFDDLAWTLEGASEDSLLRDLKLRRSPMPAHFLRMGVPAPPEPAVTESAAEIANRIERLTAQDPGAAAIWRDQAWHYTRLLAAGEAERITPNPTGQFHARTVTTFVRASEPPRPAWLGDPIPTSVCPHCAGPLTTAPCFCSDGVSYSDECPDCSGSGRRPVTSCYECMDTKVVQHGAVLTIIDRDRTLHVNWPIPDPGAPTSRGAVAAQYSAGYWTRRLGADPGMLTETSMTRVGELITGAAAHDQHDEPAAVAAYVRQQTAGRPGARIFLQVSEPAVTLTDVLRVAFGLGLAVDITCRTDRGSLLDVDDRTPDLWNLRLELPDTPITWWSAYQRRLDLAAAQAINDLHLTALSLMRDAPPQWPLPAPEAASPIDPDTAGYVHLIGAAADYLVPLGENLHVRLTASEATICGLTRFAEVRHIVTAADLPAALAALYPGGVPGDTGAG